MKLADRYTWEAEKADGTIVTEGGNLSGCVRFSLRPVDGNKLPTHDIVGVEMIRRFGRGFKRVRFNDFDEVPCNLGWTNGADMVQTPQDLRGFFKQGDLVRQRGPSEMCEWHGIISMTDTVILLDRPFTGKTAAACPSLRQTPTVPFEYLHCVICKGFRLYVRSSDGTALIAPEDFEFIYSGRVMGTKNSDNTGLYTCIKHPERMSPRRVCASAERDGIPDQFCTCCDECRGECLLTPHSHGGTPEQEWEGNRCRICGEDVSRWSRSRWWRMK